MQMTRRLAAIVFTDIVGSTAIMQKDEQIAIAVNKRYVDVLNQFVPSYQGEILNDYGDGSLCVFSSATAAMRCAIEIQQLFQTEPKVPLRIGLHTGEIFFENGKIFGDAINITSRIQSLGIANSILFSSQINSQIRNQNDFKSISLGTFHFKNVDEPLEVFAIANEGFAVPVKKKLSGKLEGIKKKQVAKKWIIISALAVLLITSAIFFYQKKFVVQGFPEMKKQLQFYLSKI